MFTARRLTASRQPPIPDSYWVVPGRLLAGEYPGARSEAGSAAPAR